jgi:hypothetical protein
MTADSAPTGVVTCHANPGWLRLQQGAIFLTIAGGLGMLGGAAVARDSASIPLAAIGGSWLLMGLFGGRQYRCTFRRISFDGLSVRFSRADGDHDVALADIREFRWPRYDINRFGPMRAITVDGTYLVAPRCRGLIDLFVALKNANPAIKLPW